MTTGTEILLLSTLTVGVIHAAAGPDHYVPFIALARAGNWSLKKALWITLGCGVGHIASSIAIALVGVAAGVGISKVQWLEASRGAIAAWLLIGFGLVYGVWGLVRAIRPKAQRHLHEHHHGDGVPHYHQHGQGGEHAVSRTTWIMFIIFVFGPCEPMIPLIMYPAAKGDYLGLIWVTALFSLATIGTMLVFVGLGVLGVQRIRFAPLEKYSHAIAGFTLLLSGLAIEFLGL
ncbi:MAG: hypothetical protein V1495_11140 [Pseudomonadota bacterium]